MMKTLFLFLLSGLSIFTNAQNAGVVRLHVKTDQGTALAFASVELLSHPGNGLVKIQFTDSAGMVDFTGLKHGNYYGRVSHAGFVTHNTNFVSVASGLHELPPVILKPMNSTLDRVTITARKPFIELLPGKTVVNLEASISSAGATALEALEKMPGITVDRDGNIALKGKPGVTVMIDGKQTYLDPAQLTTMLNGMSASQISQVEIMDQPSSKFDAAGNAGIINIKIKKSLQRGFNGSASISYAQGYYPKNNNALQMNYRSGNWNLFGNYSASFNTQFTRVYALRSYFKQDGSVESMLEQLSFIKGKVGVHNLRAGVDYTLSKKSTLGLVFTGVTLDRRSVNSNPSEWMSPQKVTDSMLVTHGVSTTDWNNAGANINFRHAFNANSELTADVDFLTYNIRGRQEINNDVTSPVAYSESIQAALPSDININSGKIDYTRRIGEVKFETGVKASHIETDNLAAYEWLDGQQWRPDYNKSNHFLYDEKIRAAYVNGETKLKKWMVQAGLRYESTSYDAHQLGNAIRKDSAFSRSYNSLFPTFFTSYGVDSNHSFSFNVGRRIDRPAFQKLNPFVIVLNKYTYQQGNPFFRPQYTWNLQLNHSFKNLLITSLGYSVTTDYFSQIFPLDSSGLVIYTEGNLGRLQHYTLSASTNLAPLSIWSLTSQATLVHKEMRGEIQSKQLHSSITQLHLNINNQFRFKKGWSAELSGFYTSASQNDIQEFVDPAGQLSVGIAKTLIGNKATIRIAARDIFYTQWMKGDTYFPQAHEYFKLTRDTRLVLLSFTYRFGKAFKTTKRSEGASGEEVQRVGNG